MPSIDSEVPPPERPSSPLRVVAAVLAGAAGIGLVAWAVWQRATEPEVPAAPPSASAPAPLDSPREAPAPGVVTPDEPAPGMVNVHVVVTVRQANGENLPVGTPLPARIGLTLRGDGGQPYEARFDRVGVWVMEVPPGRYRVPNDQEQLGGWSWTIAGVDVSKVDGEYVVTFPDDGEPSRLHLFLSRT